MTIYVCIVCDRRVFIGLDPQIALTQLVTHLVHDHRLRAPLEVQGLLAECANKAYADYGERIAKGG